MLAVKWALFVVAVAGAFPAAKWLRPRPALRLKLWTLFGLLPFLPPYLIALYTPGAAPSDTHGVEVALIDWVALTLFLAAKPAGRPAPYRLALALYYAVVLLSFAQARWPPYVIAYTWKLSRMVLVLLAVWRAGNEDERVVPAVLRGLLFGTLYEGALATWQHFGEGQLRASGTFSGWNSLGMVLNMLVMVPVARILAGPTSLLTKLAPLAAAAAALFSVSRGAMLFLGAGIALVWFASVWKEFTPRKAWFGLCGLALVAVAVPLAFSTLQRRGEEERVESNLTRERLVDAAALMLEEHPLGVGASQYLPELILGGYGRRAELGWREWTSIVHNVYWLTAAELGYAGVVALIVLFLAPLRLAFRGPLRGPRGDVLLGLGVGLAIFAVHSCFEWVWRHTEVSYPWFMNIAMVAILAQRRGRARRRADGAAPARRVPVAARPGAPVRQPAPS